MQKRKKLVSIFLLSILLISSFYWIGNDKAEAAYVYLEYQLPDPVGDSIRINSKDQYSTVANWIKNRPSNHTGWSAVLFRYNAAATTIYDGKETNWWPVAPDGEYSTQDGFEGVTYPVSMFKDKIIAEQGQEMYDRLVASGLRFDVKSGQSVSDYRKYQFDSRKEFSNPKTGDLGFLYYENNVTVFLEHYYDGTSGGNDSINAVIKGPFEVEEDDSYELDGTSSTSTGKITEWKWYELVNGKRVELSKFNYRGMDSSILERFDNNSSGGAVVTYLLEIKDNKGNTDTATHTVRITDEIESGVSADLQFEIEPLPESVTVTKEQYEADEEMTISLWVSAQNSRITNSSGTAPMWFFGDAVLSDMDGITPRFSETKLDHPKFQKYKKASVINSRLDWEDSTVLVNFTFRPKSDPYVRAGVVVKHPSSDIWDAATAVWKVPIEIPPDFDLVIRPNESDVYVGSEDGEHFVVYKDWTNKSRLEAMNGDVGLEVTQSNSSVASMEAIKMEDTDGEYTSYYMKGLKEGKTTITATYEDEQYKNKKATAVLNVYKLDLDIEPKDAELYVNTDRYLPKVKVLSTKPGEEPVDINSYDPNLKFTFEPADAVEEIFPGIYKGVKDEVVQVHAYYDGPASHGVPLSTSTTVTFKPHKPVADISMPTEVYMYEKFPIIGEGSSSLNGSIVTYDWSVSEPSKTITGSKGELMFEEKGEYEVTLTVTDNLGYTDTITEKVKVLPNYPTAHFIESGSLKENRKVILDSSNSVGSNWGDFALDHSLTEWKIEPLDGQSKDGIHIVQNTDKKILNVLFNASGQYKVSVRVTNEKGVTSEWYEKTINIEPDIEPVVDFTNESPIYRNPENENIATIMLEDASYSKDGDNIGERKWYYRFNSENDGDFTNSSWIEIPNSKDKESVQFDVKEVGKYQIKLEGIEEFGQPTIEEFYEPSMRKDDDEIKTVLVDNKAPSVSFLDIGSVQKTQVVLMVDDDFTLTDEQIEQYLSENLKQKNIDVILQRLDGSLLKFVEAQSEQEYDDGLYKGSLEKYLYSGEYVDEITKYVTDSKTFEDVLQTELWSYQYFYSNGSYNINYNKDGFVGTLKGISYNNLFSHSNSGTREGNSTFNSGLLSDSPSIFNSKPQYGYNWLPYLYQRYPNYTNITITNSDWLGDMYGPGEYKGDNGLNYTYGRSLILFFSYLENYNDTYYDITMNFGGNVTKPAVDSRVYKFKGNVESNLYRQLLNKQDWDMDVDRNVIYLSNDNHSDLDKGTADYTNLVEDLASKGIHFYGIGSGDNEEQTSAVLDGTGVNGKVFTTSNEAEVNTSLEAVAKDIISRMAKEPQTAVTVLLDDEVYATTEYSDYENDPIFEERFKFTHTPDYFENSMGIHENSGNWTSQLPKSFNKTGMYEITYQAKDDPGSINYRKWSNEAKAYIYVHRKPVAEFGAYILSETGEVKIQDKSYDLDKYSQGEKGIEFKEWSYRKLGDTTWIDGKPMILDTSNTWEIRQVVTDFQGATDEYIATVSAVSEFPNVGPIAEILVKPIHYIGDKITVINNSTDPDGDPLTHSYQVTNPSGVSETITEGDSRVDSNGNLSIVADTHPADLGKWTFTLTVSDGTETASATASTVVVDQTIQGQVTHTEQWLRNLEKYNVNYPSKAINLDPTLGLVEFLPGERFVLNSEENTENRLVNVESYIKESSRGIDYKSLYGTVSLNRLDSQNFQGGLWHESMIERFRDGEVLTFEFIGTFENGWIDTETVQVKIKDDLYWRQHTSY